MCGCRPPGPPAWPGCRSWSTRTNGYPYRFANQQVDTARRDLPAGDYGIVLAGRLVAAVKCKSLPDLVSSLTSGKLGYQLACLPRAAVVEEDGTRTCSSWNGYVRRPWPTGWPSWRCAGRAYDPTWLKLVRTLGGRGDGGAEVAGQWVGGGDGVVTASMVR